MLGVSRLRDLGEENVRTGRGLGVLMTKELVELELLDEDMTEAFRLKSAKVGCRSGWGDGVDAVTCICSISETARKAVELMNC